MKIANVSIWSSWPFLAVLTCIALCLLSPTAAPAQCNTATAAQGFNALFGNCPQDPQHRQAGFAMVDATQFGTDLCGAINNIFTNTTNAYNPSDSNGIVIDARGFPLPNTQLTCRTNPWPSNFVPSSHFSNVILLPAGTIQVFQKLVMPSNTKLVGAGSGLTTLQAISNFPTSPTPDMIDMGNSTICVTGNQTDCTGVVIEHLTLDANGQSLNGIVNTYSQELSYVNDVVFSNFTGETGLLLSTHSDNSGPYTNISYSGSGTCAQIFDTGGGATIRQTRGIHGLTCIMSGSGSTPAIYLDAPNNSLEDVYISGNSTKSQDGILIGSQGPAPNNVLFNISGVNLNDVVHISNKSNGSGTCPPGFINGVRTLYNVCDVTILGLTRSGGTNSIENDLTSPITTLTDANLGMYVVGEPVQGGSNSIGYSQFTTSNSAGAATWLVGSTHPSTPCAAGSLYSCTNAGNCPSTLWGCQGSSGWKGIK